MQATKTRYELAIEIIDHGQNEEFHQRQHNHEMQGWHKRQRLAAELEYRQRFDRPWNEAIDGRRPY